MKPLRIKAGHDIQCFAIELRIAVAPGRDPACTATAGNDGGNPFIKGSRPHGLFCISGMARDGDLTAIDFLTRKQIINYP